MTRSAVTAMTIRDRLGDEPEDGPLLDRLMSGPADCYGPC